MKRVLAVVFIAMSALSANAVIVRGGPSCSDWLMDRQTSNGNGSYNEFWLLGYLSGMAVASNTDVLRNTTNGSLMSWTDNYCRTNSLHNLEQAGGELFYELKRQKGLR